MDNVPRKSVTVIINLAKTINWSNIGPKSPVFCAWAVIVELWRRFGSQEYVSSTLHDRTECWEAEPFQWQEKPLTVNTSQVMWGMWTSYAVMHTRLIQLGPTYIRHSFITGLMVYEFMWLLKRNHRASSCLAGASTCLTRPRWRQRRNPAPLIPKYERHLACHIEDQAIPARFTGVFGHAQSFSHRRKGVLKLCSNDWPTSGTLANHWSSVVAT